MDNKLSKFKKKMFEKQLLSLVIMIFITFIIGISTFMGGCAIELPGTCIMYHEVKGISVGYNVVKKTCYMDSTLRLPYDCYQGNIIISVLEPKTAANTTCELNELNKWTDEKKAEDHMSNIPLSQNYDLMINNDRCYYANSKYKTNTYVGITFLSMTAILFIILFCSLCCPLTLCKGQRASVQIETIESLVYNNLESGQIKQ